MSSNLRTTTWSNEVLPSKQWPDEQWAAPATAAVSGLRDGELENRAVSGAHTTTCVFCQIVAGEAPAAVVARWDDTIAFRPRRPVTPGHTLVVPHIHVRDLSECPEVSARTMQRACELATPPCNIITSAWPEATQSVFHLHLHIVPRFLGDGLSLPWPNRQHSSADLSVRG